MSLAIIFNYMSSGKNRRRHKCKNHLDRTARGRCVSCGRWICTACAIVEQGSFYCADTCSQSHQEPKPAQALPAPTLPLPLPVPSQELSGAAKTADPLKRRSGVTALAIISLVLGCAAVGLSAWGLLEIRRLSSENRQLLNHNRLVVEKVNQLSNRVWKLGAALDRSADTAQAALPTNRAQRSVPRLDPTGFSGKEGASLSFDNGATDKKLVCLTFDGGGHANIAAEILDTLLSRNVKSTMFLTGNFMRAYPTIVQRIVADGHEVGNHTMDHLHLTEWETRRAHTTHPELTAEILHKQLRRASEHFEKLTGSRMAPLWRAPYGEKNATICSWGRQAGYLHVGWRQGRTWIDNLDSNDWIVDEDTPGYRAPRDVYDKILAHAHAQPYGLNGGIILMHLGTLRKNRDEQVHRILGQLIDDLRELGYSFTTVGHLVSQSGIDLPMLPAQSTESSSGHQ